ncbi:universal stress protein [Pseudomonas sp. S75]|uniref:universal stress protein n=1 Tax=unclassified Pseudomonas TaxID=196821 RepID=UPI0019049E1F|nr:MULTISPECIES: universal stress protein [unclassified Pseudomonas]MBJ9974134.1 universal stress protein [Pseudomonas sp. S30]MBK0151936.1 universal stress protein [Pseudomonas sp. S75]
MLNSLKSIAFVIDETQRGSRVADQAAILAREHGAHLIGIYSAPNPAVTTSGSFAVGEQAIREVIEGVRAAHERKALAASRYLTALSQKYGLRVEFRVIWRETDRLELLPHALHCDLILVSHPPPPSLPGLHADRILLAAGTPVLIIPERWQGEHVGRHIVLAWNGSREARQGISDAMPFVAHSEWVKVLVIDAEEAPDRHGAEPGTDIAHYLARHDARVEVERIESGDATVAEAILDFIGTAGADLLVIGAYSRGRLSELLLGGVTRALLSETPVPLLISR